MRSNHIKVILNKAQQNSNSWLFGYRDETMNHMINECSKFAQKEFKTIHWEMCKKFKFDHTNKWYMHNPTFLLGNDTHTFLWDFHIQTDHIISARRTELITIT